MLPPSRETDVPSKLREVWWSGANSTFHEPGLRSRRFETTEIPAQNFWLVEDRRPIQSHNILT
jgi:hypothetical protein